MPKLKDHVGELIVGLIVGIILLYFEPIRKSLSAATWGLPRWVFLATVVAVVIGVIWFIDRRRSVPSEARQPIKESLDSRPQNCRKNVEKDDRRDDLLEGHRSERELEDVEIALMVAMAENPPPDSRARGFAIDLGISEGRAEYHLQELCGLGLVKVRGFVGGGGYELTQKGRAYLVERRFI